MVTFLLFFYDICNVYPYKMSTTSTTVDVNQTIYIKLLKLRIDIVGGILTIGSEDIITTKIDIYP